MPKQKTESGFDVLGVGFDQSKDRFATLYQICSDYVSSNPNVGFFPRVNGDLVTIVCKINEIGLDEPSRRNLIIGEVSRIFDRFISGLNQQFRKRKAGKLDLEESKELRKYNIQKVSLNDRWELTYQRTFRCKLSNVEDK